MEFLTKEQKRQKSRSLFIAYGLFAVLISLATYILVSTALGYEIFSTKGQLVQNGLLFVDSRPSGAELYVNGKKESSKTNAKLSLPEGVYELSLKKSGYQEWRDTVKLSGGAVKFVTYPRLLPTKPEVIVDIPFQTGSPKVLQSKSKRWLAVAMPDSARLVDVYDIDSPNTPPLPLTLPDALTGGQKAQVIELIEWAGDNKHFLAKVSYGDAQHNILFNIEDQADAVDLDQMFGIVQTDRIGFWDSKWDKLYIHHEAGSVVLGDINDRSISTVPLVSDQVQNFYAVGGERAIYTVMSNDTDMNVKFMTNTKSYIFTTLKKSSNPLLVRMAGFNRNEYVVIAGGSLEKTLIFRNLESLIKKSNDARIAPFVMLPTKSSYIEFSRSNRFVLGTDGSVNSVYDLEAKEALKYPVLAKNPVTSGWFDDSRVYSVGSDGMMYVYDFNGSNRYEVSTAGSGVPYVNPDISQVAFFHTSASSQSLRFIDIATATK